jgi:LmbE family N-acetylglucosaminyl deacetylase
VGDFVDRKIAALRCHRSQVQGGPLDRIDPAAAARFLAKEHYRRAEVGSTDSTFMDALGVQLTSERV